MRGNPKLDDFNDWLEDMITDKWVAKPLYLARPPCLGNQRPCVGFDWLRRDFRITESSRVLWVVSEVILYLLEGGLVVG
jgi:hypothetical protein